MCSPSPVSLQESDESFQLFIGRCCTLSMAPLEQTLVDISVVKDQHLLALPKALVQLYNQILENNSQANQGLRDTMVSSYVFHLLLSVCQCVHMGQLDRCKPYTDFADRTDRVNYPNVHGL